MGCMIWSFLRHHNLLRRTVSFPSLEVVSTIARNQTTAYHPIGNALVESFHHQLKVAIKCQSIPEIGINSVSMVLLGICMALKNDLHCSVSKVVYGTTSHIPTEIFHSSSSNTINQVSSYSCNWAEGHNETTASYSNPSSHATKTSRE